VWLAAAITGAVVLIVVAVQVFRPRDFYTGTNNAGSSGPVATLAPGQRLCLDTLLPAGTGRIEIRGVSGPGAAPTLHTRGNGRSRWGCCRRIIQHLEDV